MLENLQAELKEGEVQSRLVAKLNLELGKVYRCVACGDHYSVRT